MRYPGFVLCTLVLAQACGARDGAPPMSAGTRDAPMTVPSIDGASTRDVRLQRDDAVVRAELAVARRAAWDVLVDAYRDVGLPEPALDRGRWSAVVENHNASRWLGGASMSTLFDCGAGPAGLNADLRRIRMTVETALETTSTGNTRLHSRAQAVAINVEGASAPPIQCSSRGTLERRIIEAVSRRLD